MVDEKLLELLIAADGFLSGEKIAEGLGVSRNCVWKRIKNLKKEGFDIESQTKNGYRFKGCNNNLSSAVIAEKTKKKIEIECVKCVQSTNTELKNSDGGEKVLIADRQTAGRGRLGKSFFSPENTGLYMSIRIYPKFKAEDAHMITAAAAVAVCRAIERFSEEKPLIKWVNDIFMNGKKVCGILTEGSADLESGGLEYAVVGIGVNLFPSAFPDDIQNIAGNVFSENKDIRNDFAAALIDEFFDIYEGRAPFTEEYKKRSFLVGKKVVSAIGEGTVTEITDRAELVLKLDSGKIKKLSAGEVSVKEKT